METARVPMVKFDDMANAALTLIAFAVFSGSSTDRLGDRLGGISSVRWDDRRRELLAVSDRGPADGTVPYSPRYHAFKVRRDGAKLDMRLERTVVFLDEQGRPFTGLSESTGSRLDSEGLAVASDGSLYVAEEYGPSVLHFHRDGRLIERIAPPDHYRPGAGRGREDNRGFEGLCLTPDGRRLAALLQSPLLQEGGRTGPRTRLVVWDQPFASATAREFSVDMPRLDGLASREFSYNELEAFGPEEFLLLERDGRGAGEDTPTERPVYKRIARLELKADGTTSRRPFADILEALARHGWDILTLPPKFESLAWGAAVGGKRTLWIAVDNDFEPRLQTVFLLFRTGESVIRN